jgi:hypothetical protein
MAVEVVPCSLCGLLMYYECSDACIIYINDQPICDNCLDVETCLEEIERLKEELSRAKNEIKYLLRRQ